MRIKRLVSIIIAGTVSLSLVACGSSQNSSSSKSNKIVVWTLANDLKTFGKHYEEKNSGKKVEVINIAPADYPKKLTAALRGKSVTPDVIVGEPQMLPNFFEDLTKKPYNATQYKDKIVNYVYEAGKDSKGVLRALSYQVTPGGISYRRDIAKKVWGNDDPKFVGEKFKDLETIEKTGEELKNKGYRIFADTGDLSYFSTGKNGEPWVKDNKLIMSKGRLDYFDTSVNLYKKSLTAFAKAWSNAWYTSMNSPVPVDEKDTNKGTTEVFAYGLPSWGTLTLRDNAKGNAGKFGVTTGPCPYFGGGTFIGISSFSKNKEAAWDFVKFCTLDDDVSQWWIKESKGDVVSNIKVLEKNKDTENEFLGGQKSYAFWLEQAKNIDYSLVTKYDTQINDYFGQAIESVQKGTATKEAALSKFYKNVKTIYPQLEVPSK